MTGEPTVVREWGVETADDLGKPVWIAHISRVAAEQDAALIGGTLVCRVRTRTRLRALSGDEEAVSRVTTTPWESVDAPRAGVDYAAPDCGNPGCRPCRSDARPCDEWQGIAETGEWCPRCGWARRHHPADLNDGDAVQGSAGTPEPRVWRHGADGNPPRITPSEAHSTRVGLRTRGGFVYRFGANGWCADGKRTAYAFWALLEKYGELTEVPSDSGEATR